MPLFIAPDTAPLPPVEDVVITASRSETLLSRMPLHVSVLTADDLAASPASSLDQVLRDVQGLNFTGVPATQTDPTGQQTRMRGLGNAKVLVLLDGAPLHDPFFLTTQWFKAPLDGIERVEVLRGGYSSLWGNMAVAGVINLVSRRVREEGGQLRVGAGSRGSREAAATLDLMAGPRLTASLGAGRSLSRGYQATPAAHRWRFPEKAPVDALDTTVQLTLRYEDAEAGRDAFLRGGYHVQDQDISYVFGSNVQRSPDFSAGLAQRVGEHGDWRATVWGQSVDFSKSNGASCWFQSAGVRCPSSVSITAAQAHGPVLQYASQQGELDYRELGTSSVFSWKSLQVGADVRRVSGSDTEVFFAAPMRLDAPQANVSSATRGSGVQRFVGAFAQWRVQPLRSVELTLAARYDTWRNADRFFVRDNAARTRRGGPLPDASRSAFDPSAALRWSAGGGLSLRAAGYRSFRAPGFNNTLRSFGATNPTIANPDLGPETVHGREVGADWRSGGWQVSGTAFRYDIRDQIATFRVTGYATAPGLVREFCADGGANLAGCGGSANFYTNDQDGRSRGIELSAEGPLASTLLVGGEWTHTSSVLTRRGKVVTDPLGVQLAGLPRDVGTLHASWDAAAGLRLRAQARYIGPMLTDTTSMPGLVSGQGSAMVFDASAAWRIARRADLTARVTNLLDREYSENAYPTAQPFNRVLSAPRTLSTELRWQF